MSLYGTMYSTVSTTFAVLIAWLFLPATYADEARLTRLPKTEQFQWKKESYPIEDGKILVEGVYYREGWLISVENVAADFKPTEGKYNWEGRPFEVRIPVRAGESKIKVKEIGPRGEVKEHWIEMFAEGEVAAPEAKPAPTPLPTPAPQAEKEPQPAEPELPSTAKLRARLELGIELRDSSEKYKGATTHTAGAWGLPRAGIDVTWRDNPSETAQSMEYSIFGSTARMQRAQQVKLPFDWTIGFRALLRKPAMSPFAQLRYENLSTVAPDYSSPAIFGESTLNYTSRRVRTAWLDFGLRSLVRPGPHEVMVSAIASLAPYSRSIVRTNPVDHNGTGLGLGGEALYRFNKQLSALMRLGVFVTRGSDVSLNFFRTSAGLTYDF